MRALNRKLNSDQWPPLIEVVSAGIPKDTALRDSSKIIQELRQVPSDAQSLAEDLCSTENNNPHNLPFSAGNIIGDDDNMMVFHPPLSQVISVSSSDTEENEEAQTSPQHPGTNPLVTKPATEQPAVPMFMSEDTNPKLNI